MSSKFEIPLDQAAKEFYEIEGRHLAILTEKEAKKHGY